MDINEALQNLVTAISQRERARLLSLFTDGMPGPVKVRANGAGRAKKTNGRAAYGSAEPYVKAAIRYIVTNPGCAAGDVIRAVKWPRNKQYLMLRVRRSGHVRITGTKSGARYFPKG